MNAANNGILKRLLGNQNLMVSFSEEETGDISLKHTNPLKMMGSCVFC